MLALVALTVLAADPPPLRAWCIDSPTIVVARVVDPVIPVRFRVTQVLRGTVKVGDVLAPGKLDPKEMQTFDEPDFENDRKPRPRRSTQALLFLDERGAAQALRLCTDDGRVMALQGGKLELVETRWPVLLQRVAADVATVERLKGYGKIASPERRTAAIVAWIERHRDDFRAGFGGTDEAPLGWGPLRLRLFDALFDTNDPLAAWTAVRLHARLFGGELLRPRGKVFETPEGRELLRKTARDPLGLSGDRVRAIALLGADACLRDLLTDKTEPVQMAAAQMLAESRQEEDITALVNAYKATAPGSFRAEVAWSISRASPARWRELTKNPQAICAVLREVEMDGEGLDLWLHARIPEGRVLEAPVFVIEELGPMGEVRATKSPSVKFLLLPRPWTEGWNGDPPLPARLSFAGLQANTRHRVRVEGVVGPKKEKWLSEAILFTTNAPPGEGGTRLPRIRGER